MERDYLWLLPPMRVAVDGDDLSLLDVTGPGWLNFPGDAAAVLAVLEKLDGSRSFEDLTSLPLARDLLAVLDEERLLVRLRRPLGEILEGRHWVSRQLAYYAQLTREYPERTLDALGETTVAIIGMGGIGSHTAQALAGAGVRRFIVMDFDTVDGSNLNRQFMYTACDVGRQKVEVAKEYLLARFPHLEVEAISENPFVTSKCAFTSAGIVLFCGESHLTGAGQGLDAQVPVIETGYIGPVGLVGPIRWPGGGTACALCTMKAFGKAEFDNFFARQVRLPSTWNCSGSTINGLMGQLISEMAMRVLAPWLGEGLTPDETLFVDMRTLAMRRETVPHVECPHRRNHAA